MGGCCDPNAPKLLMLNVGGEIVGLVAVEQAFLDVMDLGLSEEEVGEKLLGIVKRKNFVPDRAELEYKLALLEAYKNYIAARK